MKKEVADKINIAFAANDSYIPHLEIALFSLLKNNQSHSFSVYILSSDITKRSEDKLQKICRHFKNADMRMIDLDDSRLQGLEGKLHFSRDMYSRYLLPDILRDEEKVLYLDSDILVTGDISALYEQDIEGYYAAGVNDIGIAKPMFKDYLNSLNIRGEGYINSGVLVMNLSSIRRDNKVRELIETTAALAERIRHPDQDVINIVFAGKIKQLPSMWNYQDEDRKMQAVDPAEVAIVHYTTEKKPWNTPNSLREYNKDSHELYERYEQDYYREFGYLETVSVIVPVYNTDKHYLNDCFKSISEQTYPKIEIIIVDDGSSEETAEYLDDYARKDSRFKILHIKNGGTNNARKRGFEHSTGAYITFVDSDDKIENNMVHKLLRACRNDRSDVAMCEYWDDIMAITPNQDIYGTTKLNGSADILQFMYRGLPDFRSITVVVWAKLYRREVIAEIDWSFSSYSMSEDEFMSAQICSHIRYLSLVRDQLYYYRLQVATSKEYSYPLYNISSGKRIPMVQTPRDLYEKSKQLFESKKVSYDKDELLIHYIYFIARCAYKLSNSGAIDKDNLTELVAQKEAYLPQIINHQTLPYEDKIRAVLAFDSPSHVELFNSASKVYQEQISARDAEIRWLKDEVDTLRIERSQLESTKKLAVLLALNIKKRLRLRTRLRNALH